VDYHAFSNDALLARLRELAFHERAATADFMACLAEADRRADVIFGEGYPTLFDFCVRDLKLAESTAYQRVKAARIVRARPQVLSRLADGSLNVSILSLIAPWLEARPALLEEAVGKSKREVQALIAEFGGVREIPDRVRQLGPKPAPTIDDYPLPLLTSPRAAPPPIKAQEDRVPPPPPPVAVERRLEFRFAAGEPFARAVERLRAMLWHKFPAGRLEDVLFEAASDFIARRDPSREPKRRTESRRASHRSRRIPASIRRAVWRRDEARCVFSGPAGRCGEKRGLEIDHVVPWALGGRSDESSNLRLLCRTHNQSEARRIFGERASLPG
jgi:5-methylcytosine-specific restriction endonuclease McrA